VESFGERLITHYVSKHPDSRTSVVGRPEGNGAASATPVGAMRGIERSGVTAQPRPPIRAAATRRPIFLAVAWEPGGLSHVDGKTGHHPPPLVQGRFLGVVGGAGYAHILCPPTRLEPGIVLPSWNSTVHRSQQMNWDRVEGNWKQFKGKVRQQWGKLTDDDLDVIEGKRTELAGRLQQRYGYAKDQAEREIDTWLKRAS
jgi:uncharacterized protein YjbJ (UPF0337 family)